MATYTVQPVSLGRFQWAPGYEMFWMEPRAADGPLELVGLVIRGEGSTILVNTGPALHMLDRMNERWRGFEPRHQLVVEPAQQLVTALAGVGARPEEVDHVIVTPFQPYTIGNLLELTRATYWLSRTGWVDFHAPRWRTHPHDYRPFVIPEHVLVPLVTDRWAQVALLDDEHEILPGLSTFWTGGHHRASVAIRIETTDGVVIATDCAFQYENVEQCRPLGINESLEETLVAYARIRDEADIVIPLYDGRVLDRHRRPIGAAP